MSTSETGDLAAGPGSPAATAGDGGHAVTVTVRYFASARAATGTDSEPIRLPAPAAVADAVDLLRVRHSGGGLPRILDAAGFLLDGVAVRDPARPLPDGAQLDVLPPFAGG